MANSANTQITNPAFNVVFPTSGTLLTQQTPQTLTNKEIVAPTVSSALIDITSGGSFNFSHYDDGITGTVVIPMLAAGRSFSAVVNYIENILADMTFNFNGQTVKWPSGVTPSFTYPSSNTVFEVFDFFSDGTFLYGKKRGVFA